MSDACGLQAGGRLLCAQCPGRCVVPVMWAVHLPGEAGISPELPKLRKFAPDLHPLFCDLPSLASEFAVGSGCSGSCKLCGCDWVCGISRVVFLSPLSAPLSDSVIHGLGGNLQGKHKRLFCLQLLKMQISSKVRAAVTGDPDSPGERERG